MEGTKTNALSLGSAAFALKAGLVLCGAFAACSDPDSGSPASSTTGGVPAAGGTKSSATGGVPGAGGVVTTTFGGMAGPGSTSGGQSASGGSSVVTPPTGGTPNTSTGGAVGSGGAAPPTGGTTPSGGTTNTSGSPGKGGSGGAAGAPTGGSGSTFDGKCPDALVGWASVAGDNVMTTTGGGNTPAVRPANADELMQYAADAEPRVIEISGSFNTSRLTIASNKTLLGVGANATINGGIRIRASGGDRVSNVILKNLKINGSTTDVDGDAIQVYNSDHVWIDHCEVYDGVDANLDVVHGSNWVTISWSRFRYTSAAPDPEHKFSTLIGHSDDNSEEDSGRLNVTLHHNHWAEGVTERMPRVRFGKVHSFNNYFASAGNNYCLRAGRNAQLLIENNYFDGVNNPHEFNNEEDEPTAHITERGSDYTTATGAQVRGGGGTPFTMAPYSFTLDATAEVPAIVKACAGPR
jgi:pectate lyase